MSVTIIKKTSTHNTTASARRTIRYIVIHYTAGISSAKGEAADTAAYFAGTVNQTSADFIVDDDTIVQYNPDLENRYCWHSGGRERSTKGGSLYGVAKNANSIGIEVCSTNSTGKVLPANDKTWSFTDAVVDKAVELTRYLMGKYSVDADHVIRHYDVTGKLCPGIIGWNADSGDESRWKAFRAAIVSGAADASDSAGTGEFQVKVNISNLNIRTGPGTEYAKTGEYTGKGVFTIVKTSAGNGSAAGWGLLKAYQSGQNGWIALDYAERE
ncbi:MAG: N-acetylmuramoyl-L-alanine amidase [Clostridiales bacterium]|nr:N-acetylmuramoyl-L-alanine amidase [Clostridiales bacterium]